MKTNFIIVAICVAGLLNNSCNNSSKMTDMKYPVTKKTDQADDYFGTKVSDPYRWLENDTSAETKKWVEEQNKVTNEYLSKIPFRDKIKKRMAEIFNYPKYTSPYRAGEYYFFSKNDGLQNQYVTYIQKGLDGSPEVFLDPNKMSEDGTVAAFISSFSKNRKYVTYSVSMAGSDWEDIYVMEVATKNQLPDTLKWIKFGGIAWLGNGFFYSRYDKPEKGKELSAKNENHKIYFHKLGTKQDQDELVYQDPKHPLRYISAQTTQDERFLLISVSEGNSGFEVYYKNLKKADKKFKPMFTGFDNNRSVIENIGDKLIVLANTDAPKYKVVLVDPENPAKENWKTIIPEKNDLLENVEKAGGKLFACYLKDVTTKIFQYDYTGKKEREIQLPALGIAGGFSGEDDDTFVFYSFSSFTYPGTIYKYDIASGKSDVFRKSDIKFNPEDFETKTM